MCPQLYLLLEVSHRKKTIEMKVVSWQSSCVQNGKGLRYWQAKHSCSSQQFIDMTDCDWFPFQGTTTTYLDQIVSGKKYLVVQYPSLSAVEVGHSGTHVGIIWEREGSKNVVNSSVY